MANAPLIAQGTLNRVRVSVVVSSFPTLNITSPYMGKSFAHIEFSGDWVQQIPTATDVVNSPEPYIMGTITVGLLRSQALASAWLTQVQTDTGILGTVTIYSDTSAFAPISLDSTVVKSIEPGAYDGTDPIVKLTLTGVYQINQSLWNLT